jgi:hypothetical protein
MVWAGSFPMGVYTSVQASTEGRRTWTLFALAGASVSFEKRGVLWGGATWKQHDKECTRHYHHGADLIRLWRKHQ